MKATIAHYWFLRIGIATTLVFSTLLLAGQGAGALSGGLQTSASYFIRDTSIGAANTPQYDNQFIGGEGWFNLNYSNFGFDLGFRFDFFLNSNLPDPQGSYTGQGIGNWFVRKKVGNLGISVGHIYDQIGAGLIFRAYEERNLAIDNALVGLRLAYSFGENWKIKAMLGRQRNPFGANGSVTGLYKPVIVNFSGEGFVKISDKLSISPGAGLVNRILDDESMALIVAEVNTYSPVDSFLPNFNTYAFTVFNTLNAGNLSWYLEASYKSEDALRTPSGLLVNSEGTLIFSSINYAQKGFGLTLAFKRTEDFSFRTSPNELLTRGMINFLPALTRANTRRLASRYNAATQELGELAFQGDLSFRPSKSMNGLIHFSNITDLDGLLLFREIFLEQEFKRLGKSKKWSLATALQYQEYNQEVYEVKPGVPLVRSWVPIVELRYRIDRKKTIRGELQYQYTRQDFGQFLYLLMEYSVAPKWAISVTEMINVVPRASSQKDNFFSLSVSYTEGASKFIMGYFRQIEGIVCTGGICRFEPAFNGARISVNSSF